jgi:hypothetical protein
MLNPPPRHFFPVTALTTVLYIDFGTQGRDDGLGRVERMPTRHDSVKKTTPRIKYVCYIYRKRLLVLLGSL